MHFGLYYICAISCVLAVLCIDLSNTQHPGTGVNIGVIGLSVISTGRYEPGRSSVMR